VGRGALRNPWIFRQAADIAAGRQASPVTIEDRGRFLLEYMDLLLRERVGEAEGFRHVAPGPGAGNHVPAVGRERWVINKLRALGAWYTKGLVGGSDLRTAINTTQSIAQLRELIETFFSTKPVAASV
jgi:tRNA-dihydrouridine synthase